MSHIPIGSDLVPLVGARGEKISNRSLYFDKFVAHKNWRGEKNDSASRASIDRLCSIKPPDDIAALRASHTDRLLTLLERMPEGSATFVSARLLSRLAINLSEGLIQNAGICLDRVTGAPYIPGSAVKGVSRHAAIARYLAAPKEEQSALESMILAVFGKASSKSGASIVERLQGMGSEDAQGAVSFLPAYPLKDDFAIETDLTNVHTPDYYTGSGRGREFSPPGQSSALRNENPRPNPFPVVAAGAEFAFPIVLTPRSRIQPDALELLRFAKSCLIDAVSVLGLGAKTGAGYGWFEITTGAEQRAEQVAEEKKESAAIAERATLAPSSSVLAELADMNEQVLRGIVNKFAFDDRRFWPQEGDHSDDVFQLSLLNHCREERVDLISVELAKKKSKILLALNSLAARFDQQPIA